MEKEKRWQLDRVVWVRGSPSERTCDGCQEVLEAGKEVVLYRRGDEFRQAHSETCRKVVCEELGIPFERLPEGMLTRKNREEYRQLMEGQFRKLFKESFPHGESEKAADKIAEWAEAIREEKGNIIVEFSHRTSGLTTVFALSSDKERFAISVGEEKRGPEVQGIGGVFLKINDFQQVRVRQDENQREYAGFLKTRGDAVASLRIYQSGVFMFFDGLKGLRRRGKRSS